MLGARSDGSEIIICTGASEWPPQAGQEVDGYQLMMPKGVERQWHFLLDRSVGRRLTASSTSGAVRHMSFDVFGRGGQVGPRSLPGSAAPSPGPSPGTLKRTRSTLWPPHAF